MKAGFIFGTRPEFIKMAPLIGAMRSAKHEVNVISTGQHREMLLPLYEWFGIKPDVDLQIMKPDQTLPYITAACIQQLTDVLTAERFDFVLVQGDTTTCFAGALAAFYQRIPVVHLEAGLRTGNKLAPWPEELNRNLVSRIADVHLAPTENNKASLVQEGISAQAVHVTGNTVIDALLESSKKIAERGLFAPDLEAYFNGPFSDTRVVLITGHRRESFGEGFQNISQAIRKLAAKFPEVHFVYPVHMNPNVRDVMMTQLQGHRNVKLINPLNYAEFVSLMRRSHLILTDSGGVQEEAPSLGKPVLVMRENTERPEGVRAGSVRVVGTREQEIYNAVTTLLTAPDEYRKMQNVSNPYGDGKASVRIVRLLEQWNQKA